MSAALDDVGEVYLAKFEDDSPAGRWVRHESLTALVLMLSPVVPHICQALWEALGGEGLILDQGWPEVDESALQQDLIELVVQVNGKVRGQVEAPAEVDQDGAQALALANENVARFVEGKTVRKVILVPGKLLNIVVG